MSYKCFVCNQVIPAARVEFLIGDVTPLHELTCLHHSTTSKIKGIYFGEHGTSEIILCDKVYDDDVRSKFTSIEEHSPDTDEDELEEDLPS
jgi:hypothetical protein